MNKLYAIKNEGVAKEEQQSAIDARLLQILESERLLIGQELHDNVNQLLCTAKIYLGLLPAYSDEHLEVKQITWQLITEAIKEIKNLSGGLVLKRLKKETLFESTRTFIQEQEALYKISINFKAEQFNEGLITQNTKFNIYRIIQQQLQNILDHSGAKTVLIELKTDAQNIELGIHDDGVGFDPERVVNGIGLINIKERVKLLNGHCHISSAAGHGTQIHIVIPV